MYKPYTPEMATEQWDEAEDKVMSELVGYINLILTLPSSLVALKYGKPVIVGDKSGSENWRAYHEQVIALFKEAGWIVVPSEKLPNGYEFYHKGAFPHD